jgi:hypothetical protein
VSSALGTPAQMTEQPDYNADFRDMIAELLGAEARFVVVGAHAMAAHGVPRATGDFDLFVEPEAANARRVILALQAFGAPLDAHGIKETDLTSPGLVYQVGLPPRRIDLLTSIDGVPFEAAWAGRIHVSVDGLEIPVLGRAELIANKQAAGRVKDRADLELLR